jgi:hypothetical protein
LLVLHAKVQDTLVLDLGLVNFQRILCSLCKSIFVYHFPLLYLNSWNVLFWGAKLLEMSCFFYLAWHILSRVGKSQYLPSKFWQTVGDALSRCRYWNKKEKLPNPL